MIDHKVIWPEKNLEMSVSNSEFEKKYDESPAFRRFALILGLIQNTVKIGVVAALTLAGARIIGIGSADPSLLFWSLLLVSIAIFVVDDLISRILLSPIHIVSVYISGLAALIPLILYYTLKRRGGDISVIIRYATIQPTDSVFIEEFVKTGRWFNP